MQICNCLRCGWEWGSRKLARPSRCAKCGAHYWWRLKRVKCSRPEGLGRGALRKYPLDVLRVGQGISIHYDMDRRISVRQCVRHHAKKTGNEFEFNEIHGGIFIRRVK